MVLRLAHETQDAYLIEGWQLSDAHVREIARPTDLLTYKLWGQADRLTRRLPVWQRKNHGVWQVLFHQGTVVDPSSDVDAEKVPSSEDDEHERKGAHHREVGPR